MGLITRVGDMRHSYTSGKPYGTQPFTTHNRKWHNNIKIFIFFLGCNLLVETGYNWCAKLCYIGSYRYENELH